MNGTIEKFSGYLVRALDGSREEFQHFHSVKAELDDISELLKPHCDLSKCEVYFQNEHGNYNVDVLREVKVGEKYRHFKIGKVVEVIAIATHTESPDSKLVIYKHNDEVWARPYNMFISKVDKVKYPDATQEYRFELVKE